MRQYRTAQAGDTSPGTPVRYRRFVTVTRVATPERDILGEGPVWDAAKRVLWWVDIPGKAIRRLNPTDGAVQCWSLDVEPGSVTPTGSGRLLVAARDGFRLFDPESGESQHLADPEESLPDNRFNDGKCDRQGRFWAGSMFDGDDGRSGSLYRIDPDLTVTQAFGGIGIPNSLCWSPDGATMYFAETLDRIIYAFEYDTATGTPHSRRVFAEVPAPGYPDGSTVDREGFVWNAEYNGWRIVRYSPDGGIDRVVEMPVQSPTCCAFGGDDLDTLFVTSASRDVPDSELHNQPDAGGLFAVDVGSVGLPEAVFTAEL